MDDGLVLVEHELNIPAARSSSAELELAVKR